MSRLGELFYRVLKGRADDDDPVHCASCGRPITDPEQAIAIEVEEGEFVVTCCELCTWREQTKAATA